MRYSRQRAEILNIVRMNPIHPTADLVYEQARKTIPNISLGTVYRNLNQLVATEQVRPVKYDGVVHYDGNLEDHAHFICSDCKKIFDIHHPVDSLLKTINQTCKHTITDAQIEFTGICENCKTIN